MRPLANPIVNPKEIDDGLTLARSSIRLPHSGQESRLHDCCGRDSALGIGANTALFSVVNGVLLNPLPYPHPEQLVTLHESKPNFETGSISYPNFLDWERESHTFSSMAAARWYSFNLNSEVKPPILLR